MDQTSYCAQHPKTNRINRQSRGCMMQRTKTIHNLGCRWKSHDYLWIDISHAPVVEHPWHWLDVTAWHAGSCGYGSKLAWGLGMPHFQTKPYEMDIVDTKYVASRSEIWQWNILHISSGFFLASKHHVCRVFPCLITMEGANMTCGCLSSPCEVQTWNPMRLWWPRGLSPWSGIPEGFEQNRGAHKRLPAMTRYTQFHTP